MITSVPDRRPARTTPGPRAGRWLLVGSLLLGMTAMAQDAPTGPEAGEALYARECLSCHMRDGRGVPGMSPSLLASPWVLGSADALIGFVLSGGFGPNSLMASFGYLGDAELAELLTFVRARFGSDTSAITTEQVARARATFGARGATPPG